MNAEYMRNGEIKMPGPGLGRYWAIMLGVLTLALLYLIGLHSFLLFHCLVEIFSIVIAFGIFLVAWNSRQFLKTDYLLFVGIAYLFVAGLDLLHTLAYQGMGVFPGNSANLPTQLWIATRYLQCGSLLIAPIFFRRKVSLSPVFAIYSLVSLSIVASIFYWGVFPDCFVEGRGLTSFKKMSEYLISMILLGGLGLLTRHRAGLPRRVFVLIAWSIGTTIVSELAFTFYVSVYALSNLFGHFLKVIATYLMYKAIVETGLREPYELLFRELVAERDSLGREVADRRKAEEALTKTRDELEHRVCERTEELSDINKELARDITERKRAEEALYRLNRELRAISDCNQALIRAVDEQALLQDICRIICDEAGYRMAWVGYPENDDAKTIRPVAWAGAEDGYLEQARLTWADTERGQGPAGTVIRNGEIVYVQDFATDPRMAPWRANALQAGYRSGIALPLKDEDAYVFGVLLIYATESNAITLEEIRLMEELADDLAFGIIALRTRSERKRAEEDLRKMNERFALATNAARLGVWDWDIQRNELVWDDGMYALYGIKREDFAGAYEAWLKGVHPDDRARSDEISKLAQRGEREYDTECRDFLSEGSITKS